jgi:hypothetical protein
MSHVIMGAIIDFVPERGAYALCPEAHLNSPSKLNLPRSLMMM